MCCCVNVSACQRVSVCPWQHKCSSASLPQIQALPLVSSHSIHPSVTQSLSYYRTSHSAATTGLMLSGAASAAPLSETAHAVSFPGRHLDLAAPLQYADLVGRSQLLHRLSHHRPTEPSPDTDLLNLLQTQHPQHEGEAEWRRSTASAGRRAIDARPPPAARPRCRHSLLPPLLMSLSDPVRSPC